MMPGVCFKIFQQKPNKYCVWRGGERVQRKQNQVSHEGVPCIFSSTFTYNILYKLFFEIITLIGFSCILDANSNKNEKAILKRKSCQSPWILFPSFTVLFS